MRFFAFRLFQVLRVAHRCMLNLTFFATPSFFSHKNKDSGGWSIYRRKELFPLNCILGLNSSDFMQCEIQTQIDEFEFSSKKLIFHTRRFQKTTQVDMHHMTMF